MGLLSSIFSGAIQSIFSNASFNGAYRVSSGRSYNGGGWALDRFNSIVDAHSSVEDIVEDWSLDDESCPYPSVDGYANPYTQAYEEAYQKAEQEAEILAMFGEEVDPEELIDWDEVDENAYEYACDLVEAWLNGQEWIPEEILDYAWYDLSDHNL